MTPGTLTSHARLSPRPMIELVTPNPHHLASYTAALQRGWSPNNERGAAAIADELAQIEADPQSFLASLDDPEAAGRPVKTPDGSVVPRLPGFVRWMWDGAFAGSIGLRWQRGTPELPAYCLGHIGYSVVPWRQRRGYATAALLAMLDEARRRELPYVEITTDPDNLASRRVIEKNGGVLFEEFVKPKSLGGTVGVRYRIHFA